MSEKNIDTKGITVGRVVKGTFGLVGQVLKGSAWLLSKGLEACSGIDIYGTVVECSKPKGNVGKKVKSDLNKLNDIAEAKRDVANELMRERKKK